MAPPNPDSSPGPKDDMDVLRSMRAQVDKEVKSSRPLPSLVPSPRFPAILPSTFTPEFASKFPQPRFTLSSPPPVSDAENMAFDHLMQVKKEALEAQSPAERDPRSGPVFPGQISPRIQQRSPGTDNAPESVPPPAKRIKVEVKPPARERTASCQNSVQDKAREDVFHTADPGYGAPTPAPASRRKGAPVKRDPDVGYASCAAPPRAAPFSPPALSHIPAAMPSFEGFGTSDFSSIGIPPTGFVPSVSDMCEAPILGGPLMPTRPGMFPPSAHHLAATSSSSCAFGQFRYPSQPKLGAFAAPPFASNFQK